MLNPFIRWEPGLLVRYHGTLTHLHGSYHAHPCHCLNCDDPILGTARYQLAQTDGTVVLNCVRAASITPEPDDTKDGNEDDSECGRGECLGVHRGTDGYQDCDGNPI